MTTQAPVKSRGNAFRGGRQRKVVVDSGMADKVVEAVQKAGATGRIGDGKIFVIDVASAVRIRTGETDGEAL